MTPTFEDRRPWFALYVTGRADLIPPGGWMYTAILDRILTHELAAPLVRYLDAVLWKKVLSHRVLIYSRADDTGVDCVARAYAKLRLGNYGIATAMRDLYGQEAEYRRDLCQLANSHALVWYGPRERPSETGRPDPVTIAATLGIRYRVVPAPNLEPVELPEE